MFFLLFLPSKERDFGPGPGRPKGEYESSCPLRQLLYIFCWADCRAGRLLVDELQPSVCAMFRMSENPVKSDCQQ